MASGSRSTNTMTEGLRKLLGDLGDLKILPDADIPWLLNMEQQLVAKLREPYDAQKQQGIGMGAGAPPPGAGGPPGMMPPGQAPGGTPGGPPRQMVPGLSQRPQMNPDELRRVLSQGG